MGRFPPKLFILCATQAFSPYQDILNGIHAELESRSLGDVPLIGTSAAAVWFDPNIRERGAMLICLASRWLNAKVAVGPNAQHAPENAVAVMLQKLSPDPEADLNPRGNRFMLAFFPGHSEDFDPTKFRAPEILNEINTATFGRLHVFGGVSSGGLNPCVGSQFAGVEVFQHAAVAALIESDIAYGTGLEHGLTSTGQTVRVKELSSDGRAILRFEEGDAREVLEKAINSIGGYPIVLREIRSPNRGVIVPHILGGAVVPHRHVHVNSWFEIERPSSEAMLRSVLQLERAIMDLFRLSVEQVVAVLAVGCVSRYRWHEQVGYDLEGALRAAQARFPNAVHVGCYLDGEFGPNQQGQNVFMNSSVGEVLLADDIPPRSRLFLGFDSLGRYMPAAAGARTVQAAVRYSLRCIEDAGFPGAMISLVLVDRGRKWIVAQDAYGGHWKEKVLPHTRREILGADILALVANEGLPQLIIDAQHDERCDRRAAKEGGVLSFYAIPLLDDDNEVIGIAQIDLGDMRDESLLDEARAVLDTLGATTAVAISRAIRTEELVLARELDTIADECLRHSTLDEAVAHFVQRAAKSLRAEGHVRLANEDRSQLRLVGGIGEYWESAQACRSSIPVSTDPSITCEVFRTGQESIVNNAAEDPSGERILQLFPEDHVLGKALRKHKSFADFPVRQPNEKPIGSVSFSSEEPWFFSQSTLRSLKDIGRRLSQVVSHVDEKAQRQQTISQLQFLTAITPPAFESQNLYDALREQVHRIRAASNAEVVSCFLWSELQERYVLRAEVGWADKQWLNAAWFSLGEGLSGKLLKEGNSVHILDRLAPDMPKGKYLNELFDIELGPDDTYELLALPLRFRGEDLGIVTMYRRRSRSVEFRSRFATTEPSILDEAAKALSRYVYAVREADYARWLGHELERRQKVTDELRTKSRHASLAESMDAACSAIVRHYKARTCAIYQPDLERAYLHRIAHAQEEKSISIDLPPIHVRGGLLSNAFQQVKVALERHPCSSDQRKPKVVRLDNLVERVAIPLVWGHERLGVMEIRWSGRENVASDGTLPHHDEDLLWQLAGVVADSIQEKVFQQSSKRAKDALVGISGYLAVGLHRMKNDVQKLQAGLKSTADRVKPFSEKASQDLKECLGTLEGLKEMLNNARKRGLLLQHHDPKECEIYPLLQRAVEAVRLECSFVELSISAADPWLENVKLQVDEAQMEECFSNLIGNAAQVVPDAGWVKIRLGHDTDKREVSITVEDNGPGMSRTAFEDYVTGRSVQDNVYRAGIGLFMSRLFCEANGGRLELESEGPGAKFKIFLPQ